MLPSRFSLQTDSQKTYSAIQELQDGEEGLAGYNLDIVKKLVGGLGINSDTWLPSSRVVEFGAGTGTLAEVWREQFALDPICIEIDPDLLRILRSKGFTTSSSIQNLSSNIPFIYTSNVLEHIEDDVSVLRIIRNKMEKGGKIAIYVPALPILFSDLDRNVGHFRRYKKSELLRKVKLAGYEVDKCYYNDCVGVLASLLLRILGYKNKAGLGSKKSLLLYDHYAYPISKILDRLIFRYLIGKNLFLFATNPTN
jgi:hypothetical protein